MVERYGLRKAALPGDSGAMKTRVWSRLRQPSHRSAARALALVAATLLLRATSAHAAQRELLTKAGEQGTIAIDQISGFRVSSLGGFSYAAPVGVTYQSLHTEGVGGGPAVTQKSTTFFLAPSFDVFAFDKFSIGALVELAWQNASVELTPPGGAATKLDVPATTSFTLLPRLGYLFRVGDRVAIWPRLGVGYGSRQEAVGTTKVSTGALLLDVDVGLLYRINETFYLRLAPQITLAPTGSTSQPAAGGGSLSGDTTFFVFSSTVGFGLFWDP